MNLIQCLMMKDDVMIDVISYYRPISSEHSSHISKFLNAGL